MIAASDGVNRRAASERPARYFPTRDVIWTISRIRVRIRLVSASPIGSAAGLGLSVIAPNYSISKLPGT